jgi:hypothetical protein
MSTTQLTHLESGNRIQLPADWANSLGMHRLVVLDRTSEGILVRPCPTSAWEELFATDLDLDSMPSDEKAAGVEAVERTSSSGPGLVPAPAPTLLFYSSPQGHPVALPCEQFLSAPAGQCSPPPVLAEARTIRTKVYSVSVRQAAQPLLQFAAASAVPPDQGRAVAAPPFNGQTLQVSTS